MDQTLLILLIFILALGGGIYLGRLISNLKNKATQSLLKEQTDQLKLQIVTYKNQLIRQSEDFKSEFSAAKSEAALHLQKTENQRDSIRKEKDFLSDALTRRNAEFEYLQLKNLEQKEEVEKLQEKFTREFENLAHKILDQKSEKFTLLNKENIQNILDPLNEKIKIFEQKVDKNTTDFIERHSQLGEYLKNLNEQSIKISQEANNLTKALKGDNKTQGNWGELILERVLERSGLVKDREYFVQKAYTDDQGNKTLPDVVIHLPNDKRMVIDSKVSLTAYEKYTSEENADLKSKYLKAHVKSLGNHISDLSSKKYEDIHKIKSPDFVLMFIPIEPALYLAQNSDSSFFYTAFQKNILLVSPTTLLSTLRTIDTIWSNEKQQQNATEIAKHAASLYHKFKLLLDDLERVGSRLDATSKAYQSAMKKLTGNQNLIKDIDKLEHLGIAPKQKIDKTWMAPSFLEQTSVLEKK